MDFTAILKDTLRLIVETESTRNVFLMIIFGMLGLMGLKLFLNRGFDILTSKFILRGANISKIDKMSGEAFEEFIKAHFVNEKGYKVEITKGSHDYGADVVLKNSDEKIVIQAKRYKSKVGIKAVQEVVASIAYYKANRAMVITNSYYTKNALILAKANDVELWNRDDIINILKKYNKAS